MYGDNKIIYTTTILDLIKTKIKKLSVSWKTSLENPIFGKERN